MMRSMPESADIRTPPFLERMKAVFASERSNQFLLTGNIHDLVDASSLPTPVEDKKDLSAINSAWQGLSTFLAKRLSSRDHIVIRYHIGHGIRFLSNKDRAACRKAYAQDDRSRAKGFDDVINHSQQDPVLAFKALAELTRLNTAKPVSVIIDYAELLFPACEPHMQHDSDRRRLAIVRDWLSDPRFVQHRGVVLFIAETAASISTRLRNLPHLTNIEIPLPDSDERLRYMQDIKNDGDHTLEFAAEFAENPQMLAELTAGMTLRDLHSLMCDARWAGKKLDRSLVLAEVNRLLRARIGDHLDIIEPDYEMDAVIGQSALKRELDRVRQLMDIDDDTLSPVGILVAGPNGTGKTFTFTAWAGSCKRLVVMLKNLRGSYFGETDRIFEQVRGVLEALGQVIIIIDEADTQFAPPGENTHETESRLFGNLIRMMGDPHNRGRLVWVLITARPERLAPDLKRSGRAGLHLPVFDPEDEDREAFIHFVLGRAGIDLTTVDSSVQQVITEKTTTFGPADFQELANTLRCEIALGRSANVETLQYVLDNLVPIDIASQRRKQTLQAVLHCSRASLVPPSLRDVDRLQIRAELNLS